jgi:Fic family protein
LKQSQFFGTYKSDLNTRETKVVQKMLDAGSDGFEGGMTAKKYISITKTSKATATRDLQHLTELGVLQLKGGGRSVFYELNI